MLPLISGFVLLCASAVSAQSYSSSSSGTISSTTTTSGSSITTTPPSTTFSTFSTTTSATTTPSSASTTTPTGTTSSRTVSTITTSAPVTSNTTGPTANLGYVQYVGYTNTTAGINYFRGIPYAQAPIGSLRWQAPQPIELSNNFINQTIAATHIAPSCYLALPAFLALAPGTITAQNAKPQAEDCLILDVLAPTQPASSSLPVMVSIHGGGYNSGSAQSTPGDAMVNRSNGNLIYVAIQYRLGIFGFLGGSEIAQNGALNAGLLDQRAALEWVQRNIRAFGGDPSQVTIWGSSAGGGSVSYQLIANGGSDTPPFSAAIAEYPWWQPLLNSSTQERQYSIALKLSGCSNLTCLQTISASSLHTLGQADQNASYPGPGDGYGTYWFGPVVDGSFIRDLPDQEIKKGNFYKLPLLLDREGYEGYVFSNASVKSLTDETVDAMNLFPFAGPSFFSRLYQIYASSNYNSTFFQRQAWFGDFTINCPTYNMATAFSDLANASQVWKLVFYAGSETHGATSVFLYNNTTSFTSANNKTLAEIMVHYWISFAVKRNPNTLAYSGAPIWQSYTGAANPAAGQRSGFNVLNVQYTTISNAADPDAWTGCDFLSGHGYSVRN